MEGWIKLYRQIRENWIWSDPVKFKWWCDILLQVNHDEKIVKVNIGLKNIECGRGQSVMSLQNWAERWNVSKGCARHFLTLLQNDGMIKIENVTKSTRITVCNYDFYNQVTHARETHGERMVNAPETHGDPNKNVKNVKNDNNDKKEESEKIPALPKPDIINSIIQEFKTVFPEYVITTPGKERKMAGNLLEIFKKQYPDLNSDEMLKSLRAHFEACKNIPDSWLRDNMSLATMVSKYNPISKILKNEGNSGDNKRGIKPSNRDWD
jgi:hypothetical protein